MYLALTGELWGVSCKDIGGNWPRYNGTALYALPWQNHRLLYWYDHDKHSWCRDIVHVRKPALLIWSLQTLVMSGHLPREKACFIDMIMTNTRDVETSSTWESLLYWYDHYKHSWCRDIVHVRKPALLIWSWQTRDVETSSTWESLLYWYDHDKHSWCRDIVHVRKPALLIWSWQTLVMSGHRPREKACFIDMIMTNTRDVGTSSTWESLLYWYDHDKHSWCRDIVHVRKPALLIWSWQTLVMSGYRPREKATQTVGTLYYPPVKYVYILGVHHVCNQDIEYIITMTTIYQPLSSLKGPTSRPAAELLGIFVSILQTIDSIMMGQYCTWSFIDW